MTDSPADLHPRLAGSPQLSASHLQSSGPASNVIFIHGFLDGSSVWWRVLHHLDSTRFKSSRISLPGMGGVAAASGEISLEHYADLVSSLIDQVGAPVILVGQSMGSQVADLVATRRPSDIAGLVLISPVPLAGTHLPDDMVGPLRNLGGNRQGLLGLRETFSYGLDKEQVDELIESAMLMDADDVRRVVDTWDAGHPSGNEPAVYAGPVLLLRGQADGFTTREVAGIAMARYPNAKMIEIAQAGHWPQVEQAASVAATLSEFAAALASPSST